MLVVVGWRSAIVQALLPLLPSGEKTVRSDSLHPPKDGERYLFCSGMLLSKPIAEQGDNDIGHSFMVNAGSVIRACDQILEENPIARICLMGSESGFSWSFDGSYAAAKAALHRYVETKRLRTKDQQLVCIAPGIIGDAGMTTRRPDKERLLLRAAQHPKKRFLQSVEVARLIRFCLYEDAGYLSGTVIRMNGGESTCR